MIDAGMLPIFGRGCMLYVLVLLVLAMVWLSCSYVWGAFTMGSKFLPEIMSTLVQNLNVYIIIYVILVST